ncbi:putative disease resistance RPP13-like protein 1 [Neltuma alba]|uniref:putative disease resistance RPP13-like protein 1 n=1 Tax=Neltuma alba TaxID=207710 RepID=UPI0010A4343E|nr:putative disease resistance RPP13-like protein 1 [Prosopis alba]
MSGADVGIAFLSAFLQVAFDRLATGETLRYFQNRGLNETLVKKLKIMLISINSVIDDAEYKQFSDPNVRAWLLELKDAVYDAEDILDEINYEVYKRKLEAEAETQTSVTSKVRKFFFASAASFDQEIGSRMKQILENLEFLESRKIGLGLKQGVVGGAVGFDKKWQTETTSLADEVGIYGRNEDKEIIFQQLKNDRHFSVISIVGMGGLGKTTLAQLVYNDERVKREFDHRLWVCVSDDFDVLRLTKIIFKKIMPSNDDTGDLDALQNKLKDWSSKNKFLIVLDDVWCANYRSWEAFLAPFIVGVVGSRILVTSRNEKVALASRSDERYHPNQLSHEDGWLLFTKYAFSNCCPPMNFDHEEIGRRIVKKCKGLPLALKTIGILLYRKSSLEEWNNVLRSEIWNISYKDILPALILSYHYLPSHLKRCFAYCSLFPKDYEFHKEELIQLWMAHNFLQASQSNKSIEEVGNEYFQELLSRSFFQESSVNKAYFVMHDILNDLAIFVSGELCFKQEVKEVAYNLEKTRHLSFLDDGPREYQCFENLPKMKKLQTFLPLMFGNWTSSDLIFDQLCKCKCLRVLSLAFNKMIKDIPDSIGNLVHLRWLDLSYCGIERLPESICLLYNLQTLKLDGTFLVELPADFHKLKDLRLLDLRFTMLKKIPPNMGEMKNLQVRLTSFEVGKCNELNIKQLGELNLQGELSIYELQNVVHGMDALQANLKEKRYLEELCFEWNKDTNDDSQNERDVLEKLQPHQNLKKLLVDYYGGTRFPDWFADKTLSNVVELQLKSCKYCFVLPSLGLLPSLKSLLIGKLDGIVTIGAEFLGNDSSTVPFRSLETLKLEGMVNWEEWDCSTASRAFPRLEELRIRNCPRLKENLPEQLLSLDDLVIEDCPQLVALVPRAPAIQRLTLGNCGNVGLEYIPSTLNELCFRGPCTNVSLLEKIEQTISNSCIEEVAICDCPDLEFPLKQHHDSLRQIRIVRSCGSLGTFALDQVPALQHLYLCECNNLERISISEGQNHGNLTSLSIKKCPKFVCFPKKGCSAPRLEYCCFEDLENLKSVPEHINIFALSLSKLGITDCPQMESLPEGGLLSKLTHLHINRCPKLFACRMHWGLHNYDFLRDLTINGDDVVESLPEPGLLPASLTSLWIYNCSNLRMLDCKALCESPSLKYLNIVNCPRLQCLPKGGLPSSLSLFRIAGDCPALKQRCQKPEGEDWEKIAHIPYAEIY